MLDFETMLWDAHKAMIGTQSGVSTTSDKFNDNHCESEDVIQCDAIEIL